MENVQASLEDQSVYLDEMIRISKKLIDYPSMRGQGGIKEDAIYGQVIKECIEDFLEEGRALGFETYLDEKGRYGYITYGQEKPYLALLTHLDVVPPGDEKKWSYPPFEGQVMDHKLLGRGAADDKGAAAIGLMVLKAIKDQGVKLPFSLRLLVGGDEETGFGCIKAYRQIHEDPAYTLVLDGTFPYAFAEKHLLNAVIDTGSALEIKGGDNYNSVMSWVSWQQSGGLTTYQGKSAHASAPQRGKNALVKLTYSILSEDPLFQAVRLLSQEDGRHNLWMNHQDQVVDDVSINIGMVEKGKLYVDIRVPPEENLQAFQDKFEAYIQDHGFTLAYTDCLPGTSTNLDSHLAKVALQSYQRVTGDLEHMPFKTGSVTYGRSFPRNILTFGPRMPWHITNTHQVDEFVELGLLEMAFKVYYQTILNLGGK